MDLQELRGLLESFNIQLTEAELQAKLAEIDEDQSGEIDFDEFVGTRSLANARLWW